MQFTVLDKDRIAAEWPVIAEILAPAVRNDPRQTLEGLHKRLEAGLDSLLMITGPGRCLMVIELADDLACWIKYLGGSIEGGPKARVSIIRGAVEHLETVAKDAGCTEIRLCGRDWSRICREYQPMPDWPNGLRKVL